MKSLFGAKTRNSDIIMYKNGTITFTSYVYKTLNLEEGDVIDIIQDNDNELYIVLKIKKAIGKHKGKLKLNKKGVKTLHTHTKEVVKYMFEFCNEKDAKAIAFYVGSPCKVSGYDVALPIITHNYDKRN
jgi:bifunctional DNA-binding transcriptional regulator/antitoxin component of YhaV-PrlF toxin-antitoxin module